LLVDFLKEDRMAAGDNVVDAFIEAACVPLDSGHASGTLDVATVLLARHPDIASRSIHAAAALGNADEVRRFVGDAAATATATGGPRGWDALTHLCFSRYLRLDRARSDDFVRAATVLLDAGASANTGWMEHNHQPTPQWESALYGAAGVAHHPGLTKLLLERGADPNDEETPYHAPETYDNAALKILVESGRLNIESLSMILLRKTDWHDYEGIKWLLDRGVDADVMTRWGKTALHNAILSDNDLRIVELLLDHGANPAAVATHPERGSSKPGHQTAVQMAARRGRGDVLDLFARRGVALDFHGLERLLAACARHDAPAAQSIAADERTSVRELQSGGGRFLAWFAGVGNTEGVRLLLDLGVAVDAPFVEGEGYFDVAPNSLAIHVAAWRANHATLRLLIERGSPIDPRDGKGRTPLQLAVRACVDSYWTRRRSPESVKALLDAGASIAGVSFPCGYAEVDESLARHSS
jgi:ankyrin repeat protein